MNKLEGIHGSILSYEKSVQAGNKDNNYWLSFFVQNIKSKTLVKFLNSSYTQKAQGVSFINFCLRKFKIPDFVCVRIYKNSIQNRNMSSQNCRYANLQALILFSEKKFYNLL